MVPKLANKSEVFALAQDLGLKPSNDPVRDILKYVRKRVLSYLQEFPCERLTDLLGVVAAKVDTLFLEVDTDADLRQIRAKYVAAGEFCFAEIDSEFADSDTFGITYRLKNPKPGERKFVSVIDCRGDKGWRSYFTKWHELAHLLTLTTQQRLKFYRTHADSAHKDPEESVMDVVAGNIGFFDEIVRKYTKGPISFQVIGELKARLCPEASGQASLFGFLQAWPTPGILIEAEWAWKKRDRERVANGSLRVVPDAALRAVHVTVNEAARNGGLFIPQNMRVPATSVIARILQSDEAEMEAHEDLSWWTSSDGGQLNLLPIRVIARRSHGGVQALITPAR